MAGDYLGFDEDARYARRKGRAHIAAVAAVGLIMGGTGLWGLADEPWDSEPSGSIEGPMLTFPETEGWPAAEIRGQLTLEDGCLLVGDAVAVWPHGAAWDGDSEAVLFDDLSIPAGHFVIGGGGAFGPSDDLAESFGEMTWRAAVDCVRSAGADGIVMVWPTEVAAQPKDVEPRR